LAFILPLLLAHPLLILLYLALTLFKLP